MGVGFHSEAKNLKRIRTIIRNELESMRYWREEDLFPAVRNTGKNSVMTLYLYEGDRKPVESWNKSRIANFILTWIVSPSSWPEG